MEYLVVKYLHILSSTFLFGTGVGTAFYLLLASLSRDVRVIAAVARYVVIADWLFTATTMVIQPLSGWYLARLTGMPLTTPWLYWSIVLFIVAALCWLPVVWLQMRLRDIAADCVARGVPLPPRYARHFAIWIMLGVPALFSFLAIFYLMVAKSSLQG